MKREKIISEIPEHIFATLEKDREFMQESFDKCSSIISQIEEYTARKQNDLKQCDSIRNIVLNSNIPENIKNALKGYLSELKLSDRMIDKEIKTLEDRLVSHEESFTFFRKKIERSIKQLIQEKDDVREEQIEEVVYDFENKRIIYSVAEK